MRKRILALALCAGMLLLGGCASEVGVTSNPTESPTGTTSSQVENEIPPEESGELVSEPEDPVETNEPEEVSGIIAMTSEISGDCTFNIVCIDPSTGEQRTLLDVTYTSNVGKDIYYLPPTMTVYSASASEWVSSDFSKIAATKYISGTGEYHAGWFNEFGEFYDVTEALGLQAQSDFDDPACYFAGGFTDDCFVYYANNTSYDGRNYFYVPLTNITLDAVQEGDIINSALPTLPADSDSGYNLSGWVNETQCLVDQYVKQYNRKTNSVIFDITTGEVTEFIPGTSRYNWNGVLSPDGSSVAFLSSPKQGTDSPALYITPLSGGDPIRVETTLSFSDSHSINSPNFVQYPASGGICTTLIDWR